MTPPDLTPEQVIAERLAHFEATTGGTFHADDVDAYYDEWAQSILTALRNHGPVGWEDVRERLTSEGAVEATARYLYDLEPNERVADNERSDARAALSAAISYAREA